MVIKNSMNCMAIIPARLGSTRLKDKPLQLIQGKPLISRVVDSVKKTGLFSDVIVATDSEKIASLFSESEVLAVMTDPNHQSGTDRIFEALKKTQKTPDFVINIQGDEPFIYKEDLMKVSKALEEGYEMASVYEKLKDDDLENPNRVKVLINDLSEAIYFSRLKIPFSREEAGDLNSKYIGKHIGLYGYSANFLKSFCEAPTGFFEFNEKLEQLRALEMGKKIKMIYTENRYQGIDTPEDILLVEALLSGEEG